jgi:hypothetical protein
VSGIFRGSEEELVERTLATERQVEQLEAELADLRVRRQFLTSLLAKQQRRGWLPEAKGLVFGGLLVFAAPLGLVILVSLLAGVFSLLR